MLAIVTKYLPATDTLGSRLVASTRYGSGQTRRVRVSWDFEIDDDANHDAAALALLARSSPAATSPHLPGVRLVGSAELAPGVRVHLFAARSAPVVFPKPDAPLPYFLDDLLAESAAR